MLVMPGVRCFQCFASGIHLPKEARFAVSDDGREFTEVATAKPALPPSAPGPEISILKAEDLAVRGRFVRMQAANIGLIPRDKPAAGTKAWLFVDELLVNPRNARSPIPPS
jgi:hexosaminidase